MERRTTPDEPMDGAVDGTFGQPLDERIEQQLRASVRVLLPPVQLVVGRKRDTLFEFALGVRGPADDVTLLLQPHSHVEILRDIVLRPNLLLPIGGIYERRVLNGRPPEETGGITRH